MLQTVHSLRRQCAPQPNVWALLVATTLLVFGSSAQSQSPTTESVESLVLRLADPSPITRRRAADHLLAEVTGVDQLQRERIIQTMLRESLLADLETQLTIDRLLDEITSLAHRQNVDRIVLGMLATPDQVDSSESPLAETWRTFAGRVGNDREARETFRQIALRAGPTLHWPQLSHLPTRDQRRERAGITLISHLGCVVPETPQPHSVQAKRVLSQIRQTPLAEHSVTRADAGSRVMGRLIDRTLQENPYGWTMAERLHLGLLYQRDRETETLCQDVLLAQRPLAGDLAAAILARQQLIATANLPTSETGMEVTLAASRQDRRVVSVSPEQLVGQPRNSTNSLPMLPAIIRTRVQDVAVWASLQNAPQRDLREHGMWGLQADPVWGTRLSSIGFASEAERAAFLAWAETVHADH